MEEILPVESVQEDFEHLSVLEIGFTFYFRFIDEDGKPTQNYHVLRRHRQFMKEGGLARPQHATCHFSPEDTPGWAVL